MAVVGTKFDPQDLVLKINTIESDIKYLREDFADIAKNVNSLSEVRSDMKLFNESLMNIANNQGDSIKVIKKDLNNLGNKIRDVESKVGQMSASVVESKTKIEINERAFWILFAASVAVVQHFVLN